MPTLISCLIFLALISNGSTSLRAKSDKLLVMGVAESQRQGAPKITEASLNFLKKAYGEHGYQFKIEVLPFKRLLWLLDKGDLDGNLARSEAIEAESKNIVKVPEPIITLSSIIITREPSPQAPPNTTGIEIGDASSRNLAQGTTILEANNLEMLISMLKEQRVKQVIISTAHVERFSEIPNFKIKRLESKLTLYTYLNKKHADLAKKVGKTMLRLKQEGAFRKEYLKSGVGNIYDLLVPMNTGEANNGN